MQGRAGGHDVVHEHQGPAGQILRGTASPGRPRVQDEGASDVAATRYAITVPMVLDFLDDKRNALKQALRSNRIPIAKEILTDIYAIEPALRTRIGQFDKSDWGRRLDELMTAVDDDLQAEFRTLPENTGHVLGARTLRRHSTSGLLTSLVRRSRDALVESATRVEGLFGLGQRSAGGPTEASTPATPRIEKINGR
jgi:hypothetical protein